MVEKNQYDITVDAVVTDIKNKLDGIYRVKTDGAEFDAYANSGTYYKDDQVLVQIPNGNYGNQKFILGRKIDETVANQTFNLKLPFDDFVGLQHLSKDNSVTGQYWANYPGFALENAPTGRVDENGNPIIENPTFVWKWENPGISTIGNTRLGIQADWQVLLGHYQPLRGTYGFRIITKGTASTTDTSSDINVVQEDYFTNRDMYGNTYAFFVPYTQQKVIDISNFLEIESIEIHFYQDYNFADASNAYITYRDYGSNGKPEEPENILFDALDVYLGISNEDLSEETVKLFSYDPLSYTGIEHKPQKAGEVTTWTCEDERTLQCAWIHKEENKMFSVIDDVDELLAQGQSSGKDTHVYWYRRNYPEIKGTEEILFPGQSYIINEDGSYSPAYDDSGNPIFDLEVPRAEEYKDLFLDLTHEKDNPSYESRITRYGGDGWTFIPAATDKFVYTFAPRGNKSREKFKVVVQHHGTHTSSEEIILKNTRDVEAEAANGARNDALILQTYKVIKEKENDEWSGNYIAVKDNTINAFHVYDENNKVLYNDDDERYDEHYYYLQVHFRNEDTYEYETLQTIAENGLSVGTTVSWSMPQDYTMIKSSMSVNKEDAKLFGIDAENEEVRYNNFCNATIKFQIKETLNNRYQNNTVNAIIVRNNDTHHIEKVLDFGRAEGQGHEFAPIVEIIQPAGGSYICQNEDFQIGVAVYNRDGSLFENPELLSFSWRELGGESQFINYGKNNELEEAAEGYLIDKYYYTDESYNEAFFNKYRRYSNNVVRGRLINNAPPIFEVKVYGAGDYPLVARFAPMVCNNYEYKQQRDIMIPSRVEFKSDGTNPIFYNEYFTIDVMEVGADLLISHLAEWPEWQLNEKGQKLFHLESAKVKQNTVETTTAEDGTETTAPVEREYTKYRLRSNAEFTDDNGVKQDRLQWSDNLLKTDYYSYIYFNDGDYYVAQALAFDRNYYASSLVNDWNGVSLTWDEENGAVLSTMIAAGSKDSENRFTGVMMGDWSSKGDESLDVPGMYGYHQGAQSFGFKTDGTGFIGKSGRGRIQFDGNEAIISNADRTCYINLNPISLREMPNAIGNQSFSSNFLYCEVPRSSNSFTSLSDGILGINSWVREYFKNDTKDYFIVDPNHGVLTTGGIVARYGALGNWMISNEGMYQKSEAEKAYMYLGFDQLNINTSSEWNNRKSDIEKAQRDMSANYTLIHTYEDQIVVAEAEKDAAQTEVNASQQTREDILADANRNIEINQSLIDECEEKIADLEELIAEYEKQITDIENTRQNLLKRKSECQDRQRTTETALQEAIAKLDKMDSDIANQLTAVQADKTFLTNVQAEIINNNIKSNIDSYAFEYEQLLGQKENIEILIAQLTTTINLLEVEIAQEYVKVSELISQQNIYTSQISDLQNDINLSEVVIKMAMREAYSAEESQVIKTVSEFEADANQATIELNQITTRIEELNTIVETLNAEIAELTENNTDGSNDQIIAEKNEQKNNAITELNEKTTQKLDLENKINVINSSLIPKVQQLNSTQKELDDAQAELEELNNEYDEQLELYNSKLTSRDDNIKVRESYNSELLQVNINFSNLKRNILYIESSLDSYHSIIINYESSYNIKNIPEYPEIENTEIDDITDINNLLQEIGSDEGKYNNILNRLNNLNIAVDNERIKLEKEASENEEIVSQNNRINELSQIVNDLIAEIEQINIELAPLNNNIISLNNLITQNEQLIEDENIKINGGYLVEGNSSTYYEGYSNNIKIEQIRISAQNTALEDLMKILAAKTARVEALLENKNIAISENTQIIFALKDLQNIIKKSDVNYTIVSDIDESNYIDVITAMINAINAIMLNGAARYAIYVAEREPLSFIADYETMVKPFFSVDWKGTMYTRKGLIANTWVIDDTSLTYKKNNDKMYLGQGSSNTGRVYDKDSDNNIFIAYPPNTNPDEETGENSTVSAGWDISAGVIVTSANADPRYEVKFGVTTDGRLYSEYGRIGGWDISKTTLVSTPSSTGNQIIFDAGNNQIRFSNGAFVVDGDKGTVFLGQMTEDGTLMRGNVYLAEFKLSGQSAISNGGSLGYSQQVINADNASTTSTTIGGIADDYGWGGVSASGTTIGVGSNKLIDGLNFSLDASKTNYLQFFDASENPNHNEYGVVLAVGNKSGKDSSEVEMIFYPKKNGGILGLKDNRWNIIADNISANIIEAESGCIKSPYMLEPSSPDPSTIKLLASQWWVTEQLKKIWDALADVSASAAQASQTSWSKAIVAADWGATMGNGTYQIYMIFTRGNGSKFQSSSTGDLAAGAHGHTLKASREGTNLKLGIVRGANTDESEHTISLDHTHAWEGSFSEGTFTITVGGANFNDTGSKTYTYNVASSNWFKRQAFAYTRVAQNTVYVISAAGGTLDTVSFQAAIDTARAAGESAGYSSGYDAGYDVGYNKGFAAGKRAASGATEK